MVFTCARTISDERYDKNGCMIDDEGREEKRERP